MKKVIAFVFAAAISAQCELVEIRGNIKSLFLNSNMGVTFKIKNVEIKNGSTWIPYDASNTKHNMKGMATTEVNFLYGLGDTNADAKKLAYSVIQAAASAGAKVNITIDPAAKCENTWWTCNISGASANGVIVEY